MTHYMAFASNKLATLDIPATVTEIEKLAFYQNELTELVITDSVTKIGEDAFSNNELVDVFIPDSVMEIEKEDFDYNRDMKSIELPKGCNYHRDAFYTGVAVRFRD